MFASDGTEVSRSCGQGVYMQISACACMLTNHSLQRLLLPTYPLLATVAARFPFETAIGMNGQVWVKAQEVKQTIALGRAIGEVDAGRIKVESLGQWLDGIDGILGE